MTNDERVIKLSKQLDVKLSYANMLEETRVVKPNKSKLQDLAKKIRKEFEDTSLENTVHKNTAH
jgi:hypothetical protein